YWLFARIGVGAFSSKTWVEESTGDRAVVAGERNLEAHSAAASILLGESEQKAQKAMVEVWGNGAPNYDQTFHGPGGEHVGGDAAGGAAAGGAAAAAAKPAADKK